MKRILRSNLFYACVITLTTFLMFFALSGFKILCSGDDYTNAFLIIKGNNRGIFISRFLSDLLIPIQSVFGNVNVYSVFMLVVGFLSAASVYYVTLGLLNGSPKRAIFTCFIIAVLFSSLYFVHLQWTMISVVSVTAGYLLLYYASYKADKGYIKAIQRILAVILIIYSSLIRFNAFLSASVVIGVCVLYNAALPVIKSKRFTSKDRNFKLAVLFLVLFVSLSGLQLYSNAVKSNTEGYREYYNYSENRSNLYDYPSLPFEGNEKAYQSVGINSQNDIDVFLRCALDDDFFTADRLSKISDINSDKLSAINNIKDYFAENKVVSIALAAIVVLALVLAVLLRKKLRLLLPILLTLIWVITFAIVKVHDYNILAVFVFGAVMLTAYTFNRYHFGFIASLSMVVCALQLYLFFTRVNFRSTFTLYFPAIISLLLFIDKSNLRQELNQYKPDLRKYCIIALSVVLAVFSALAGFKVYKSEVYDRDYTGLYDYITDNSNKVFVLGAGAGMPAMFQNPDNCLSLSKIPDNLIPSSTSLVGLDICEKIKADNGVGKLYREMVDSGIVYISIESYREKLEQYFNDHYSENGNHISFKELNKFGSVVLYQVISNQGEQK